MSRIDEYNVWWSPIFRDENSSNSMSQVEMIVTMTWIPILALSIHIRKVVFDILYFPRRTPCHDLSMLYTISCVENFQKAMKTSLWTADPNNKNIVSPFFPSRPLVTCIKRLVQAFIASREPSIRAPLHSSFSLSQHDGT